MYPRQFIVEILFIITPPKLNGGWLLNVKMYDHDLRFVTSLEGLIQH